jgi:glutamate/tyrosine decarboxylase-like PLP-dependent enzyme
MADNEISNAERLEKALHFSNTMQTFNLAKNNLKVKVQNLLSFSAYGGTFTVNQELIGFIGTLVNMGKKEVVILDKNENPIQIEDLEDFLEDITSLYFESVNEYYNDYQKLKSSRKIDKVLDIL